MKLHPWPHLKQHAHALAKGNGHEPRGNNDMADKYVKSPYTLHHPHNMSMGVKTKYVTIAKEGAKGTTHAYTSEQTRTTPNEP